MRKLHPIFVLGLAILVCDIYLAGCANYPVEQAKKDLGVVTAVRVEAQAQYAKAHADYVAAKTPEQKAAALTRLKESAKRESDAVRAESLVQGVIKTADDGVVDPAVRDVLMGVPYGNYILLALSAGGWLYSDYRKRNAQTALRQVVTGVEVAKATDPTLADTLHPALDAASDESTKAQVAAIRATLPSVPDEVEAPKEVTK